MFNIGEKSPQEVYGSTPCKERRRYTQLRKHRPLPEYRQLNFHPGLKQTAVLEVTA
jgi:hypothetical protein